MKKSYKNKWIPFLLVLSLLTGAFAPAAAVGEELTGDFGLSVTDISAFYGSSNGEDDTGNAVSEEGTPDPADFTNPVDGTETSGASDAEDGTGSAGFFNDVHGTGSADITNLTDGVEASDAAGITDGTGDMQAAAGDAVDTAPGDSMDVAWTGGAVPNDLSEGGDIPEETSEEENILFDSLEDPNQAEGEGIDSEGLIEEMQEESGDGLPGVDEPMFLLPEGFDPTVLGEPEVLTQVWVNPVYEDVIAPDDLIPTQSELEAEEEQACLAAQETAQELDAALAQQAAEAARMQQEQSGSVQSSQEQFGSAQTEWEQAGLVQADGEEAVSSLAAAEEDVFSEELLSCDSWEEVAEYVDFEPEEILADQGYYQTDEIPALGAEIRGYLRSRTSHFSFGFAVPASSKAVSKEEVSAQAKKAVYAAMEHTGVPTEGDYLLYQLGGDFQMVYKFDYHNTFFYIVSYTMSYYTTAAQEAEMDRAVAALLPSLKSAGNTDYARIKAAYDYLGSNVSYDNRIKTNEKYLLMYTGYAALVNKTAVCQGYSVALYRLLLEMGIDCRVIGGQGPDSSGKYVGHAWNIIRLGSRYYNADATWDAKPLRHNYFLKAQSESGFDSKHFRDSEYKTAAFISEYPMSTSDYPTGSSACTHQHTKTVGATAPTCVKTGLTAGTVCSDCGQTLSGREIMLPTGHLYTDWTKVSDPTITAPGLYVRSCVRCVTVQHRYTDRASSYITLNIKKKTIKLKKGKTKKLKVSFAAGDKVTKIKSSKPKVVSVTKKGKMKARQKGKAKITVTLLSGLTKSFWVKVP